MVDHQAYLINAIIYIHLNPVYHQFFVSPKEWSHSSYHAYLSDKPTRLPRKYVLKQFGGREEFEKIHLLKTEESVIETWER